MATRSFIAKKVKGGYIGIYCHWDGYPQKPGVGWVLRKYYKSPAKINKLISLGDISVLRENIGKKHKMDVIGTEYEKLNRAKWTSAYHRDRGEAWNDAKPKKAKSIQELKRIAGGMGAEYLYIYEKGKWFTKKIPMSYW
jgi:hypothetical protein